MIRFIAQRAMWGVLVVMSVVTLVFFLIFVAGDPAVTGFRNGMFRFWVIHFLVCQFLGGSVLGGSVLKLRNPKPH